MSATFVLPLKIAITDTNTVVSIFVSGAVFAIGEGVRSLLGGEAEQELVWVAYAVLAASFLAEGTSWLKALKQARSEARGERKGLLAYLRAGSRGLEEFTGGLEALDCAEFQPAEDLRRALLAGARLGR